jgi:hypothetical protein
VRGVAVHAHRHGLDQRRALAGERALAAPAVASNIASTSLPSTDSAGKP